jgi:hypothetical protein
MFLNQDKNNLGYWSPVTSIIDWCEPNYQHFDKVAETYNTFSSLAYVFLTFWSLYKLEQLYSSHATTKKLRMVRTYVSLASALVVAVGTYLFHMTLLRENQMLDEVSMNSLILIQIYALINMGDDVEQKEQDGKKKYLNCFGLFYTTKATITAVCCLTLFSISVAVYDTMIPVVFQTLFGLSILTGLILSGFQAVKKYENISIEYKKHFETAKKDKIALLLTVIAVAIIGFGLWLIDNHTCPRFEFAKFHACWHICTAYAAYMWGVFTTHCQATDRLAQLLSTGEPVAVTKLIFSFLRFVYFYKVAEKPNIQ